MGQHSGAKFACVAWCPWLGAPRSAALCVPAVAHDEFRFHVVVRIRSGLWKEISACPVKQPVEILVRRGVGRKQLPSGRAVSVDTLMPLEYFPLVECFCCHGGKTLPISTQRCSQACGSFSSRASSLTPPACPIVFDVAGFSFPNTFSLASSLSHFLCTYPAVKLHCSLRLRSTLLQQGDLQHFAMSLLYKK